MAFSGTKGLGAAVHASFFLIEKSYIKLQETDQPDSVLDLADAHGLAGEDLAEVDFAFADADPSAAGHAHAAVVIGVLGLVDSGRRCIHMVGAAQGLVGALVIVNLGETFEAFLLLQEVEGRSGGFGLRRCSLMRWILMPRRSHHKLCVRGGAVVGADSSP